MEVVFCEEVRGRTDAGWCIRWPAAECLSPQQLVEDIGTEFEELNRGQALQFIAGLVRREGRFAIA